jgi:predicted RecA/RadA family phage recombinase
MKNYIQEGEVVTLTAPYAVSSGGGALVGALFGVAVTDVANGAEGEFSIEGVYTLPKATGALTQGAKVYWDNSAKKVTATATDNTLIGCALKAAASGDATAVVRLNGTV